ncbi:MAG: MFS transporter [Candidatus Korarchaeota archaeon]|nr:MFS transporter [Candidatus Korarchaeota archaeon]
MGDRRLALNLLSVALYFLSLWLIASVLARYARDLGIGLTEISLVWSAVSLITLVMRPLTGYLADRSSSNLTMMVGSILSLLSSIIFLFSSDFASLLMGRVVQGFGNSFFIAPSAVAVASTSSRIGLALGLRSMLISLGGVLGPPLAGLLADSLGYWAVFSLAAVSSLTIAAMNADLRRGEGNGKVEQAGWRDAFRGTVLLSMSLAALGGAALMVILELVQVHYRDLGYGASIFGYFSMFFGAAGLISRYLSGRMAESRPMAAISLGYGIMLLSLVALSIWYLPPLSYGIAALFGLGLGFTVPAQQYVTIGSVPEGARNRAMALYSMGADVGRFSGPIVMGFIASLLDYSRAYLLTALFPLASAPMLILLSRRMGNA